MRRRTAPQRTSIKTHGLIGAVARSHAGYTTPHSTVWFDTDDGVRLAGTLLPGPGGDTAVVVVHGFNG